VLSTPATVLAVLALALQGGVALAQGAEKAAEGPVQSGNPYEPVLMIIVPTVIFLAGILITRLLLSRKLFKSPAIFMPILVVLSGAVWLGMMQANHSSVENLYHFARFLFVFMLFVSLLYLVSKAAIPSEAQRTRAGLPPLIRTFVLLFAGFLGLFLLLMWSFPDLSLTPIFVTSGIVTLVIGLGVQSLLGNLMSGVLVSAERLFEVGDWVQIGDAEGEVIEIGWRSTRLRTRQSDLVEIPNCVIVQAPILNFNQPSSLHLLTICITVADDTPPGLAAHALLEAAARVEGVLTRPAPAAHLMDFRENALAYELQVWVDNYESAPVVQSDLRKEIWYAFRRHGVAVSAAARDAGLRQEGAAAQPRARLVATAGLPRGALFEIDGKQTRIGRDPNSQVCIDDHRVSSEHAVIELQEGRFVLRDLGGHLGTQVNGRPISSVALRPGDEIEIGHVRLVFESSAVAKG
jgi:small-conductance mechanosensitive channel